MKRYDVAVIGAGPAGLSAALNAAARNKSVVVIGPPMSEKLKKTDFIDNYLGLPALSGEELLNRFREHLGGRADYVRQMAQMVADMGGYFGILLPANEILEARAVVLATGVNSGRQIPGEAAFLGRGASTCATCDAALYRGKSVVVVGYNDHAVEEARFISELAASTLFVNQLGREVALPDSIPVRCDKPKELQGDDRARRLVFAQDHVEADGFFFIRDAKEPTQLIPGLETEGAHVVVNSSMATNLPGVFAAGDCIGRPYQINAACGQGQIAGLEAAAFATARKKSEEGN
ncbi:MAG: NAD(P)/FAD-dependent oxidoreductase [Ndongobacter sp.]|nr:NAD(P)/FAD-dependent oxidoreductase [Ndongobacter sp.]